MVMLVLLTWTIMEVLCKKGVIIVESLKQWICDVCGELIATPEDGYVVWRKNKENKIEDMRIIHHNKRVNGDRDKSYNLSLQLGEFLGDNGKVEFLSLIDPGPYFTDEYKDRIADKIKILEAFRRLQIPYYQEAGLYWGKAIADGFFDGANEVKTYLPDNLKTLIETYKDS